MKDDEALLKARELAGEINKIFDGLLEHDDSPAPLDDEQKARRDELTAKYQSRQYTMYLTLWGRIKRRFQYLTHDTAIINLMTFLQDEVARISTRRKDFASGSFADQFSENCIKGLEELEADLEELALIPVHRARRERGEE